MYIKRFNLGYSFWNIMYVILIVFNVIRLRFFFFDEGNCCVYGKEYEVGEFVLGFLDNIGSC